MNWDTEVQKSLDQQKCSRQSSCRQKLSWMKFSFAELSWFWLNCDSLFCLTMIFHSFTHRTTSLLQIVRRVGLKHWAEYKFGSVPSVTCYRSASNMSSLSLSLSVSKFMNLIFINLMNWLPHMRGHLRDSNSEKCFWK